MARPRPYRPFQDAAERVDCIAWPEVENTCTPDAAAYNCCSASVPRFSAPALVNVRLTAVVSDQEAQVWGLVPRQLQQHATAVLRAQGGRRDCPLTGCGSLATAVLQARRVPGLWSPA